MSVAPSTPLADAEARRAALTDLHHTMLVEAGAGSGKTSLMAGRVVMLLVAGVPPREIAAITFTTLAAADLAARIRAFVDALLDHEVPPELRPVVPRGLAADERERLARARAQLDDLTSTTIHGFCQDLLRPYPVEADVDPGARVIDQVEAELLFDDVRERWLREILGEDADPSGAIASMTAVDAGAAIELVRDVIAIARSERGVRPPTGGDVVAASDAFVRAAQAVEAETGGAGAPVEAARFAEAAVELRRHLEPHAAQPAALALAALTLPRTHLHTQAGGYRKYQTTGAWKRVDRERGAARHAAGVAALATLEEAEARLCEAAACTALAAVMGELAGLAERYARAKRHAAQLDFDDLIDHAERLLRCHPEVRRTLAERFRHVLVDEFQDTDPLQARIVWLLCSDAPAPERDEAAWPPLRPGSLFAVGDPKQSIYRFRGADVHAYRAARDAIARGPGGRLLSVSTNFRSLDSVLAFANARFSAPLEAPAQPGYAPLAPARRDGAGVPRVCRLAVAAEPETVPNAADRRDLEADAVAAAVAGMIGHVRLPARGDEPCRPGDVALLAPTGSDLWRFERALEDRGIAVSSQAGKGFYARQEVQDLIALTRVLADERDTLALGALLRGPLLGFADEALLDVAERAYRAGVPGGRLSLTTPSELVGDDALARTLAVLQDLHALAARTTPAALLQEAVARLRVRAVLTARHGRHADRAVANLERFLELAGPFDVRGLGAFARTLRARWRDGEASVEGRPDSTTDAVTLITVHSSKGLEWPVVVPINTFGPVPRRDPPVLERASRTLHARVLGKRYPGLEQALEAERTAEAEERVRLWYVAATRAQDLLVLPSAGFATEPGWWCEVVDLELGALPELPVRAPSPPAVSGPGRGRADAREAEEPAPGAPTRARFEQERRTLAGLRRLSWGPPPSRLPDDEEPPMEPPHPQVEGAEDRVDVDPWPVPAPLARGRVLHALLHEVVSGVVADDEASLVRRASELVQRLGPRDDGSGNGPLAPLRLAREVRRGLAHPLVAAHRAALVSEVPVYGWHDGPDGEEATAGIADAVAFDTDGRALLVVDWKSDAHAPSERVARYEAQLRRYLELVGAGRGVLVFLSTGEAREVTTGG